MFLFVIRKLNVDVNKQVYIYQKDCSLSRILVTNKVAKIVAIDAIMKADCHTGVNMEVTRAELCAHARGLPLNHSNVAFVRKKTASH